MLTKSFGLAAGLALFTIAASHRTTADIGKPGLTPVPCPDRAWETTDPAFDPLPHAKVSFGQYDGGVYRIEKPDDWNGELVLWAHGYAPEGGPQGGRLRVDTPGGGRGTSPFRQHLIERGFAWAASSYRCNGYVPGTGLLDTIALVDLFTKFNESKAPARVYLTGGSMGGHVTVLGMQEFPTKFAGGLALCASGPGEMDFLSSVGTAAELIAGVRVSDSTHDQDVAKLADVLGKPPSYTQKGRQLASVQLQISGGPRPFAMEGLSSRFIENASFAVDDNSKLIWARVATNADTSYAIEDGLGMTAKEINDHVRRKAADREARSDRGPYEEAIPFDGKLERPLLTIHNTGDLYVPISLERTLKHAVDSAGRSPYLVQRIVRSAGHCSFSPQELNRGFDDMVVWARGGSRPEGDDVLGDLTNAGLKFTEPLRPGDPGTRRVGELVTSQQQARDR
jgi:pimeloyl-ACP methyl ester carboxylesterase